MVYRAGAERARPLSYVSAGVLDLTGRPAEAFSSGRTPWRDLVAPEDLAAVEQAVESALRERRGFSLVHRIVHASGAVRWVMDQCRLVAGQNGEPVAFEGVVSEVTGLRQEADALRQSEARFRGTFDRASVGLAHVELKQLGRWLRVNDRLCEMTGYSREELLGRTFQDLTHPDDLEEDLHQTRRLLAGEITAFSMEKRYVRKGGQIFWGNLRRSVLRTASGEPECVIAVIEDVTDRRLAETSVQDTGEWLRLAQAAGGVGVFDWLPAAGEARCSDYLFDLIGRPARCGGKLLEAEAIGWIHPDDRERAVAAAPTRPGSTIT